jgi:hypothetical protein
MPFKIQRVPRALQQILAINDGTTPQELEDRIRGVIDLLQLYGTTQLQSGFTSATIAEGAAVAVTLHASAWTVLFAAQAGVAKTATMTALRLNCTLNRATQFSPLLFAESLGPFGATETGSVSIGGFLPYPLICPPGSVIRAGLEILGTDANASVTCQAEFGVLG